MARLRSYGNSDHSENLALVLVDYDNLITTFGETAKEKGHRIVVSMVGELRRYLSEELRVKPVRAIAYGDFGINGENASSVMAGLAAAGLETRHIPAGVQSTDAAMSLSIDATELLHDRPDVSAFILLSGDNWYVPLVQHLQRFGKFVLVTALDLPPAMTQLWSEVSDAFLNARFLLDAGDRDSMSRKRTGVDAGRAGNGQNPQERAPAETTRVDEAGAYRALELIDEYFGQYEEVYLTPLLRKMSEMLEEEDGEPKDLVNVLQEAGAVWLEKRRGFPYDYTVLMVNDGHPDVEEIREANEDNDEFDGGYGDDYDSEYTEHDDHEYEDAGR